MHSWTPEQYDRILPNEVLPLVSKPNRYVGNELGLIEKDWEAAEVRLLLCYPDAYEVGMSHTGTQILYHLVNRDPRWLLDRAYAPWPDMEKALREREIPLWGLQYRHAIREYDIIGFTLQSELTYTNLLNVLDLAGVPVRAEDRGEYDPVVLVGGPCVSNPEPMAAFFDCALIGDAEEAVGEVLEIVGEWKKAAVQGCGGAGDGRGMGGINGRENRAATPKGVLLERLATEVPGIYVPSLYEVPEGGGTPKPKADAPEGTPFPVVARKVPELRPDDYPKQPLVSLTETTHDRLPIEVMRGCVRGCRFCLAGFLYRPSRERGILETLDLAEQGIAHSGWNEVSVLSLSTADYSQATELADSLSRSLVDRGVSVALPSLRADEFSVGLADAVSRVRKSGFTFAPEAGSQRLRNVINKGFTEEDILGAVERAMEAGWMGVKLYFMIGHPTETEEDLEELVSLVRKIRAILARFPGKRRVTVSLSPFVPKAFTPFQWERQDSVDETRAKLAWLRTRLKGKGIEFRHHDIAATTIEGLISRGGREAANHIEGAWKRGARFDGWSEHRDFRVWDETLEEHGVTWQDLFKERKEVEELPWEVVSWRVDRDFILDERRASRDAALTGDCKNEECSVCGVCDFDTLENVVSDPVATKAPERPVGLLQGKPGTTVRLRYQKGDQVRFLSHLDMMRELERNLRRASVPVLFTEGYSPRPKLSAGPPLPLGWTSECEWIDVELAGDWSESRLTDLLADLNTKAAPGIEFLQAAAMPKKTVSLNAGIATVSYVARFPSPPFSTSLGELTEMAGEFLEKGSVLVPRRGKKRSSEVDIRPMVREFAVVGEDEVVLRLTTVDGKTVRPTEVLRVALGLEEDRVPLIQIFKSDTRFATGDRPTTGALVRTEVKSFETRNIDISHQPARNPRGDSGGRSPS
jgi:radical SAM-linked protein